MTTTNRAALESLPALTPSQVTVTARNGYLVVKAPYRAAFAVRMRAFGCPSSFDTATRTYIVSERYRRELWTALAHWYRGCELVGAKGRRVI